MAQLVILVLMDQCLLAGQFDAISLLVELLEIGGGEIDVIHVLLWKFVEFDVDDARGIAVVLEAVLVYEVD